jgi:hypothetical protein
MQTDGQVDRQTDRETDRHRQAGKQREMTTVIFAFRNASKMCKSILLSGSKDLVDRIINC